MRGNLQFPNRWLAPLWLVSCCVLLPARVHVVETDLVGPLEPGQARTALSSAFYEVVTPHRDVTLFDEYVDESQLTIDGSSARIPYSPRQLVCACRLHYSGGV